MYNYFINIYQRSKERRNVKEKGRKERKKKKKKKKMRRAHM